VCARACPRFRDWEEKADAKLFGRARLPEEVEGVLRALYFARATDPAVRDRGQDGGVVSGLLCWGLTSGRLDGVVTSGLREGRRWDPIPTVARTTDAVLAAAGSRYSYSPNPLALEQAVDLGLRRIALVGPSCQASVPAVMASRGLHKWSRRIAWTFGLLCSKTFEASALGSYLRRELGIDWARVVRMNIKGKLIIECADGAVVEVPLREANQWTRPACRACPDFAAEHADISFGGLGKADRWTLVIIRTDVGQSIWEDATAEGVVEWRSADQDPDALSLLRRMAETQRRRWPADDGSGRSNKPGVTPRPG
jgi:coenzyme F420 hydrogenase subunit beta